MVDPYDLGGQCFFWEMATAVAGWQLAINPFDQPDVEAAKILARKMIAEYREKGAMPAETPSLKASGLSVYGDVTAGNAGGGPRGVSRAGEAGRVCRAPGLSDALPRDGRGAAAPPDADPGPFPSVTTVGYGPRFLHSTGQLHKGDAGRGLFIQLTADDPRDAPIPDELGRPESALTFGVLKQAQVFGDRQALLNAGRRAIRIHLHGDAAGGLARLTAAL